MTKKEEEIKNIEIEEIIKEVEEIEKKKEEKEKLREFNFELIFEKIKTILKRYVDLTEECYTIVTLWIIGTYLHKYFPSYPFLYFNAMKGSGKTRLLKLISTLAKNGDLVVNISEAAFFRTVKGKTLCIDEFERTAKEKAVLRELLNAAYKRGTKVVRMTKVKGKKREKMVVEEFDVYAPICMANVYGMDDVLQDRCITLILEKSTKKQIIKKMETFEYDNDIQEVKKILNELFSDTSGVTLLDLDIITNIIESWNKFVDLYYNRELQKEENITSINYIYNNKESLDTYVSFVPKETLETLNIDLYYLFSKIINSDISGRQLELFFPLLIIACFCRIFDYALETISKIAESKTQEELIEDRDTLLLGFIAKELSETNDFIAVSEIARGFKEYLEGAEWVSSDWVGRALRRLNLIIFKRRTSRRREVVIDFKKAKEKYKFISGENVKDNEIKKEEETIKENNKNVKKNISRPKVYFALRDIDIVVSYNGEDVNLSIPKGGFVEAEAFGDFKEKIIDMLIEEKYLVPFEQNLYP